MDFRPALHKDWADLTSEKAGSLPGLPKGLPKIPYVGRI